MAGRKLTRQDLRDAAEKYKNWGKWGPDDEIGTLNYTEPEDIIAAAQLVKKGKVISLALNFDNNGPQGGKTNYPALGRINPLHTMLRTGTDAYSGVQGRPGCCCTVVRLPVTATVRIVFFASSAISVLLRPLAAD